MKFRARNCYHIYNQGNNRQRIFYEPENYLFFLSKVHRLPQPAFTVIAYCLMPNHFHFLIYADFAQEQEKEQSKNLSIQLGAFLSSYTKAMNKRYGRSGSLFRSNTKAKCLTGEKGSKEYLSTCFHYIHQNPIRASLVNTMDAWPYSSYRDYAGYRKGTLPAIEKGREILEIKSAEEFIHLSQQTVAPNLLERIW